VENFLDPPTIRRRVKFRDPSEGRACPDCRDQSCRGPHNVFGIDHPELDLAQETPQAATIPGSNLDHLIDSQMAEQAQSRPKRRPHRTQMQAPTRTQAGPPYPACTCTSSHARAKASEIQAWAQCNPYSCQTSTCQDPIQDPTIPTIPIRGMTYLTNPDTRYPRRNPAHPATGLERMHEIKSLSRNRGGQRVRHGLIRGIVLGATTAVGIVLNINSETAQTNASIRLGESSTSGVQVHCSFSSAANVPT
jgi:hypothetical protein